MSAPHLPKVAGIDSTVPAPAHTVAPAPAAPGAAPAPRRAGRPGADPGPAGRLGLRPHHPPRTHRASGPHRHARRRAAGDCCAPEPPWSAPAAVSSSSNRPTASARTPPSASASAAPTSATSRPCRAAPPPYGRILDGLPDGPASGPRSPSPTCSPRTASTPATARSPPASATPPATRCRSVHRGGRPRSARPSGSTTSPPSRSSASATSSACTAGTPPSTWPGCSSSSAPARRMATIAEELLPTRLPRVPGVQLAARHRTGPRGGGDWYDALPLPEGALGLAVGSVTGSGPERGRRDGAAARLAAGVRRDGGRGPGRRPLRPGAAAAADRARPLRHRALRLLRARRCARSCWPGPGTARRWWSASGAPSSWRRPCPRRWACSPAGRRRAWSSTRRARRDGAALHRRAAAPHRRPDGPGLRPAARGRGVRAAGRCATTRARSPTTCCARCCRRGSDAADGDEDVGAARGPVRVTSPAGRTLEAGRSGHAAGAAPSAPVGRPSARPYDGRRSSAVSRRQTVAEELTPATPDTDAADPEPQKSSRSSSGRTACTRACPTSSPRT